MNWDDRLRHAMGQAGWIYDKSTHGFRKRGEWVSYGQAEEAFAAAERDEAQVITPASQTVARIVAGAENDQMARRCRDAGVVPVSGASSNGESWSIVDYAKRVAANDA